MMPLFLTMFLVVGGAMIGMSVPLIQRKVAPNLWYGFRTPRTLADPEVWYPANAYAACRTLRLGIATVIVAVAAYFVPGLGLAVYASIVGAVVLIGLLVVLVQSFVYLGKLPEDGAKEGSGPDEPPSC